MRRFHREIPTGLIVLAVLMMTAGLAGVAQSEPQDTSSIEERLTSFNERLRFSLSITSFAIYAPSLGDLRLHAQRVVNLIEGSSGAHYVRQEQPEEIRGMRQDVVDMVDWFSEANLEADTRARIAAATRNVAVYLEMALDSALSALRQRRLDEAITEMMRAYAFLAAAHERPSNAAQVPGLWTILRQFGLAEIGTETETDS